MSKQINFTVLIPVFNTPDQQLLEAANSVINQTKLAEKIILIDDGSTNSDTLAMLKTLEAFCEVRYCEKNGGTSKALNIGHTMVQTEYVAIMGSQDISHKERFKKQCDFLAAHQGIDVLGTQLSGFLDKDVNRKRTFSTHHPQYIKSLNRDKGQHPGWITNHGTVMYKQAAVMHCDAYDETIGRGQDVDLWRRMFNKGKKFANLQEVLYSWRRYK